MSLLYFLFPGRQVIANFLSIKLLNYLVIQIFFTNFIFENYFFMDGEDFYGSAYNGSKQFSQQDVRTANATRFGAAADDYGERGIVSNQHLIKNKPATFFFRM